MNDPELHVRESNYQFALMFDAFVHRIYDQCNHCICFAIEYDKAFKSRQVFIDKLT